MLMSLHFFTIQKSNKFEKFNQHGEREECYFGQESYSSIPSLTGEIKMQNRNREYEDRRSLAPLPEIAYPLSQTLW